MHRGESPAADLRNPFSGGGGKQKARIGAEGVGEGQGTAALGLISPLDSFRPAPARRDRARKLRRDACEVVEDETGRGGPHTSEAEWRERERERG
jgi:hypothetical protein